MTSNLLIMALKTIIKTLDMDSLVVEGTIKTSMKLIRSQHTMTYFLGKANLALDHIKSIKQEFIQKANNTEEAIFNLLKDQTIIEAKFFIQRVKDIRKHISLLSDSSLNEINNLKDQHFMRSIEKIKELNNKENNINISININTNKKRKELDNINENENENENEIVNIILSLKKYKYNGEK